MLSIHILLEGTGQTAGHIHVLRMNDQQLPKVLHRQLAEGKQSVRRPKLCFKDNLKSTSKNFEIPSDNWEALASGFYTWQSLTSQGAVAAEQCCRAAGEVNRQLGKQKLLVTLPS